MLCRAKVFGMTQSVVSNWSVGWPLQAATFDATCGSCSSLKVFGMTHVLMSGFGVQPFA